MLKYNGGGFGGSIPNIPARDLTDEEVLMFGKELLLLCGLYEEPQEADIHVEKAYVKPPIGNKMKIPLSENKEE